jgi:hypothetical protein
MRKTIILLAISLTLIDCSSEKNTIPIINLQNAAQAKVINLSDMLKDIYIVQLETSADILLGEDTYYLVSEKFIITIDREKILQFSGTGRFIRTLAKVGKGPDEFLRAEAFALDEKNEILYVNHRGDSKNIGVYNLKDGKRFKRILTGVDNLISQIAVLKDTVLVITPRMNQEYNLFYLSTTGKIISGIAPPKVKGIGLQSSIEKVSNKLYYMPKEYDTLYLAKNTAKEPYCFFNVEDRFTYDNNEIGNFVYLSLIAPDFMIVNKIHAAIKMNGDGETYSMNADKAELFLIDNKNFTVTGIKKFHNDFFGVEDPFDPWKNYLFTNNELGFIRNSSYNLKLLIKQALETGNLENPVKQRISLLYGQINENDNPILVIGKYKSK